MGVFSAYSPRSTPDKKGLAMQCFLAHRLAFAFQFR
jgi:hypothetical protein